MEWLKAIQWDHPGIFGPIAAAAVAGVFLVVTALIKSKKPLSPTVKVGLDEEAVGQVLSKRVDPLKARIEAFSDQLATAQLAPKQPLPDSADRLKVYAVKFFNAGLDAYHEGEIGQAIGHWLDALQLDPDLADAHSAIGILMHAKGELDLAIEHYSAALRIEPDDALAHSNLGVSLRSIGDLDAAIEHCNAAIQINPRTALYHHNLARVLAQKKDAVAAVAALAKAIELDPRYRDKAKTDTDYDHIRDDPAFHKLLDAD